MKNTNILFFLLILSSNTYAININKQTIVLGLIGTAATLFIGKMLCTAYYDYIWPNQSLINYCHTSYKEINEKIKYYTNLYATDAQISDWALKEKIYENSSDTYPFIAYHTHIVDALYVLDLDLSLINKSLYRIIYRKKHAADPAQLDMFNQLEMHYKQLKQQITRIISLFTLLRNRVSLFQEYYDDCYHWKQEKEREERENRWEIKEEKDNPDAFERVEQEIIQFNLDYY